MKTERDLYGLVVCGGQSQRMGKDKAFLTYFQKPQCFHIADLLNDRPSICERVLISCNDQQRKLIPDEYHPMPDLSDYKENGPIASLLTAFEIYPDNDFLVIGCDYPLLTKRELHSFLNNIRRDQIAATFYNKDDKYEPLIGWYAAECAPLVKQFFVDGNRSLQHFLRINNAEKYIPDNEETMMSADTPDAYNRIHNILKNQP
ncbi:MAG TPA: molybdenum cofactor guanylyltransferase [Dyadobacter sp.]|jgi:molybdopterin-guanine dinucleotide biosynthesis protein A|nr:molybdenum cofactor guanylyltransferase [Dyadobacter sp.]